MALRVHALVLMAVHVLVVIESCGCSESEL